MSLLVVCCSINVLKLIRLPSLKICTILLCGLVIYDIFFVFITPYITSVSIGLVQFSGESDSVPERKGGNCVVIRANFHKLL